MTDSTCEYGLWSRIRFFPVFCFLSFIFFYFLGSRFAIPSARMGKLAVRYQKTFCEQEKPHQPD